MSDTPSFDPYEISKDKDRGIGPMLPLRAEPLGPGEINDIVNRHPENEDVLTLAGEVIRLTSGMEQWKKRLSRQARSYQEFSTVEGSRGIEATRMRFLEAPRPYRPPEDELSTAGLISLAFVLVVGMILVFALSAALFAQDALRATAGFAGGVLAGFGRMVR